MATGKNIEIRIAATGGDQAAREIDKVADAAAKIPEGRGMGGMLDGTVPRTDEAAESFESAAEAAEKLTDSLPDLTDGELANEAMERIASGTAGAGAEAAAATGRFAGLGRSLLSLAGGPVGLAITGISAAVGVAAKAFQSWQARIDTFNSLLSKQNEISVESAVKIREMGEAAEQTARLKGEAAARSAEMAEAIARITEAQTPYNEALEKEISLLKQKQAAENAIAQARGQTEVAQAEGDPVRQEEIRQRLRREQQQRELRQIEQERAKRQDLLGRREADLPRVQELGAQTVADLEGRAAEAEQAALERRKFAEAARARQQAQQAALRQNREGGGTAQEYNQILEEAKLAKRNADEATREAESLEAEAKSLAKAASEAKSQVEKDTAAIAAAMQKLYDEIQQLELERGTKTAVFTEADAQGDIRLDRTRQQAEEQRRREQQQAERERLQAELEAQRGGLDQNARSTGLDLRNRGLASGNETAAVVGKALSDGTNSAELQKLSDRVREEAAKNSAAQTQYMLQILDALEAQARKNEQLEQRIRNLPK